jgi:hypothetical protein
MVVSSSVSVNAIVKKLEKSRKRSQQDRSVGSSGHASPKGKRAKAEPLPVVPQNPRAKSLPPARALFPPKPTLREQILADELTAARFEISGLRNGLTSAEARLQVL